MKYHQFFLLLILIAVVAVPALRESTAQDNTQPDSQEADVVPQAALLTERGRQLAKELRLLLDSKENLGAKHPSLPIIEEKVEAIKEQLRAWEPAIGGPAPNPFKTGQSGMASNNQPQMNEYDLRQVVLRLTQRVAALEKRVAELESNR